MAISNRAHIPGPTFEGREHPQEFGDGRDQLSGIIFFNEQGDEVGGLVYNGYPVDDRHWAGGLGIERLFVGSQNETAQVQIRDPAGRVRVRLFVDPEDNARLEFPDAQGRVTKSLPE